MARRTKFVSAVAALVHGGVVRQPALQDKA